MPARCSAFTMSRNSSSGAERVRAASCRPVRREERDRLIAPVVEEPGGASCGSNWKTGSSSTAVTPRSCRYGIFSISRRRCRARWRRRPELGCRVKPRDVHLVDDRSPNGAAAARRPPSRTPAGRRRRSSWRVRSCRPGRAGRLAVVGRRHGDASHTDRAAPSGVEAQPALGRRTGRARGRHRAGPAPSRGRDVPVVIGPVLAASSRITRAGPAPPRRRTAGARRRGVLRETLKLTPLGRPSPRAARSNPGRGPGAWGPFISRGGSPTVTGSTCQMSSQYSRIARSEEKYPMRATLRIDMRVQGRLRIGVAGALLALDVGVKSARSRYSSRSRRERTSGSEQLAVAVRKGAGAIRSSASRSSGSARDLPPAGSPGWRAATSVRSGRTGRSSPRPRARGSRVRAVEGADGERAVEGELHVAGAGGFLARGRDLLRQVRRGVYACAVLDVEVG